MTTTKLKLCRDCIHIRRDESFEFAKCARTSVLDVVSGEQIMTFCTVERREYPGCCGPEAKFFEAKDKP